MTEPKCSFCEKLASDTKRLIGGSKNPSVMICEMCILMCTHALFDCIIPKVFVGDKGKPKLVRD